MRQPSYKEVVELAIRLATHDRFDKKWILYPAFATPPPRSKPALDEAVRYREEAAKILRHELQPPAWLIRELAPEHEPRMSAEDVLFLEEVQQYFPNVKSLDDLELRKRQMSRKWRPEPKPLHTIRHYPGEFRRFGTRWPLAILNLWQSLTKQESEKRRTVPVLCWRMPYRAQTVHTYPVLIRQSGPDPPRRGASLTLAAAPYGWRGGYGVPEQVFDMGSIKQNSRSFLRGETPAGGALFFSAG